MATISAITSGPSDPFGEPDEKGNRMVGYQITTDEGQSGVVYRKTSSKPLEVGMEVEPNGRTQKGTPKFKVAYNRGGSTAGGKGEFRSPEQIIRTSALEASVAYFAGQSKPESVVLATAAQFAAYITGSPSTPPAAPAEAHDEISF